MPKVKRRGRVVTGFESTIVIVSLIFTSEDTLHGRYLHHPGDVYGTAIHLTASITSMQSSIHWTMSLAYVPPGASEALESTAWNRHLRWHRHHDIWYCETETKSTEGKRKLNEWRSHQERKLISTVHVAKFQLSYTSFTSHFLKVLTVTKYLFPNFKQWESTPH